MIAAVVAYANDNVIGDSNRLPWYLPEDLKHFKDLTTNSTIIMGRKTYDSIGRPLPNRTNIVMSRHNHLDIPGVIICHDVKQALEQASDGNIFIIGGAEIYKLFWDYIDTIYATVIEKDIPGDTHFPKIDSSKWQLQEFERHHSNSIEADYVFTKFTPRAEVPKLYHLNAARGIEQLAQMEDLESRGICAFCEEHFKKEHKEPVVLETDNWLVSYNDYPYKDTRLHLLIIPKKHISKLDEMDNATAKEYMDILRQIESKYELESYSHFMRIGDFRYNGGSVQHLHGHIIVADLDNQQWETIKVKLGSR